METEIIMDSFLSSPAYLSAVLVTRYILIESYLIISFSVYFYSNTQNYKPSAFAENSA